MQQSFNLISAYLQKCFKRHLVQHCSGVGLVGDNWAIPQISHPVRPSQPLQRNPRGTSTSAWEPLLEAVPSCTNLLLFPDPKMPFVANLFENHVKNKTRRREGVKKKRIVQGSPFCLNQYRNFCPEHHLIVCWRANSIKLSSNMQKWYDFTMITYSLPQLAGSERLHLSSTIVSNYMISFEHSSTSRALVCSAAESDSQTKSLQHVFTHIK